MNLPELIEYVLNDLGRSLQAVWPELSLCAAIVLVLLARMIFSTRKASGLPYYITLLGALAALGFLCLDVHSWPQLSSEQHFVVVPPDPEPIFTGLLVLDSFGVVMRSLLILFLVLFVSFTRV
ncbi:MAG: hypothetical protein ABSG53_05100, partial [Thermoguttaceae bacterium]